jgi:hypothetical protein
MLQYFIQGVSNFISTNQDGGLYISIYLAVHICVYIMSDSMTDK